MVSIERHRPTLGRAACASRPGDDISPKARRCPGETDFQGSQSPALRPPVCRVSADRGSAIGPPGPRSCGLGDNWSKIQRDRRARPSLEIAIAARTRWMTSFRKSNARMDGQGHEHHHSEGVVLDRDAGPAGQGWVLVALLLDRDACSRRSIVTIGRAATHVLKSPGGARAPAKPIQNAFRPAGDVVRVGRRAVRKESPQTEPRYRCARRAASASSDETEAPLLASARESSISR